MIDTKPVALSDNSKIVLANRYAFHEGENWEGLSNRVGSVGAEPEQDKSKYNDLFSNIIGSQLFIPAGRILRNAGRAKGSLFNCYALGIGDSINEIGHFIADCLTLWSEGGGVGCNFSTLRPRGANIIGKGGKSSGLVSFMKAADAVANTVESGGQRRAAALGLCEVSHPEIIDFIDAKMVSGALSCFNISVGVTNDFIDAVESDALWEFKFQNQSYGTIPAREIWSKILFNMHKSAEPGLINMTNLRSNNSWYYDPIVSTNPCVTGDTIIPVAGRGHVTIKQLSEEGADIPVYCLNKSTSKVEIQMMRNPRKTGDNQRILKIHLDNGGYIKRNEVHQVIMKDETNRKVCDLNIGDSIHHMTLNYGPTDQHSITLYNGYNHTDPMFLHRINGEFLKGSKLTESEVVHHKDERHQNNGFDNLEIMEFSEHSKLHQLSSNNVMRDKWWNNQSEERKDEYRKNMSESTTGENNGNWSGVTKEYYYKFTVNLLKSFGRNLTKDEFKKYCVECGLPKESGFVTGGKSHRQFLDDIAIELGYSTQRLRLPNTEFIKKSCEVCNSDLILPYNKREISICPMCVDSYLSNKNEQCIEVSQNSLNFKVVRIEECGFEDVYNGTVDKHHNFYSYVNDDLSNGGYKRENYVCDVNCGEVPLGKNNVCNLGSLVLPNFVTNVNTNWKKLEEVIGLGVRFLDNIIDMNNYALKAIDLKAHESRRIGLGILGLGDYLMAKKIRYGSVKAVQETERLMRFIRDATYEASVKLSVEKGSFPKFDSFYYSKSHFIRTLPASIRMDIKKYGTRNATLLSVAPNGTIGLLCDTTGGVEPLFSKAYKRTDNIGERIYIHPKYEDILLKGEGTPDWFVDAYDLYPQEHLEMQVAVQKYIDCSVSKTINLPSHTTVEDLDVILLEYIKDLKGITVYRDGCRDGQPLNTITESEAIEYLRKEGKIADDNSTTVVSRNLTTDDVKCHNGKCDL